MGMAHDDHARMWRPWCGPVAVQRWTGCASSLIGLRARVSGGVLSPLQLNGPQTATAAAHRAPIRELAHVTGHAKPKKKAKSSQGVKKIKPKADRGATQNKRKTSLTKKVPKKYVDPSTRPDYPLGPQQLESTRSTTLHNSHAHPVQAVKSSGVVVPPALLLPTASPHVFVAKVACQEVGLDSRQLFTSVDRHATDHRSYSFCYFPPHSFPRQRSDTTSTSASTMFPTTSQPEVCFLGRSNVGKSSLINALMRQTLAVTSKQPGRTQQAYYYGWIPKTPHSARSSRASESPVGSKSNAALTSSLDALGFLVDLPGYGYAVGSDEAVQTWQRATQDFLLQRRDGETLRRVFVLQDTRLQSPQAIDQDVQQWLEEAEIPYTTVLTKADSHYQRNGDGTVTGSPTAGVIKHVNLCSLRYQQLWTEASTGVSPSDEDESDDDAYDSDEAQELGAIMMSPVVHVTSAKKKTGLAELLTSIETEFLAANAD